jgi:SAC3 family protein LENG8/THP3
MLVDQLSNRNDSPTVNKKAKKNALKHAAQQPLDVNDTAALNRRAERFQREHELERTKNLRSGGIQPLRVNQHTAHLFRDMSLSRGGSPFGHSDDPEADPVRFFVSETFMT